jgi:dCMP deaminase
LITARDYKWMKHCVDGAATFSTCAKRQYMCYLVDQHGFQVGAGYNGVPSGFVHCFDGGCPRLTQGSPAGSNYGNCLSVHAEANALLHSDYTARRGGVTLYVNGPPCWDCAKLIANASVNRVVYVEDKAYADWPRVEGLLEQAGIVVVGVPPEDL